jgi:ABC-type transport system substrate-binding protein
MPGTPSYITSLQNRSYNPTKAKQLLADAGYPTGFRTAIQVDVASTPDKDAILAIQAYLSQVGIRAEVNFLQFAGYNEYRTRGWKNGLLAGANIGQLPIRDKIR